MGNDPFYILTLLRLFEIREKRKIYCAKNKQIAKKNIARQVSHTFAQTDFAKKKCCFIFISQQCLQSDRWQENIMRFVIFLSCSKRSNQDYLVIMPQIRRKHSNFMYL